MVNTKNQVLIEEESFFLLLACPVMRDSTTTKWQFQPCTVHLAIMSAMDTQWAFLHNTEKGNSHLFLGCVPAISLNCRRWKTKWRAKKLHLVTSSMTNLCTSSSWIGHATKDCMVSKHRKAPSGHMSKRRSGGVLLRKRDVDDPISHILRWGPHTYFFVACVACEYIRCVIVQSSSITYS